MGELLYDLRDTWRGLRRDRLYALTVIGTLALTLGASTAVFSIVNGVLLRPLDYPGHESLVSIREIEAGAARRYPTLPVTPRHFEIWRGRAASFSSMAMMDWRKSTLTGAGEAVQVTTLRASGTLFDVLQIPVALGRGLAADDERAERPRVAVVSDVFWRERLGGQPSVLGQQIMLGGTGYTVVGVLPRGVGLPSLQTLGESGTITADVAAVIPFRLNLANYDWMGQFNYGVVARLKPGVTLQQARAEMDVVQGSVAEIARRETHEAADLRGWVVPLEETIVGPVRRGLLLLLGAIGIVLLIACANLANLTLTRTAGRLRDAAVRGALGASRGRLVRGVLVEQLLLGLAGGGLGVMIAAAALRAFVTTAPVSLPRVQEVALDGRVLAFALITAIVASIVVAWLSAWRVGSNTLESVLRSGGRSVDRGGQRVRGALLTAQVALSVMLLAIGALFVSSLTHLLRVDAGFAAEGALTVEIAPVSSRYPDTAARAALYDRVLQGVRTQPGIVAASWTSALPLTGETWVDRIVRPDRPGARNADTSANYRFIGPEYFRAIGMPILQGRSIEEQDRAHTRVPAVISSRAAHALWPGENVVGRDFTRSNQNEHFEIVGVVADGHVTALESESPLMVYVPYWYNNEGKSVLVVRTQGDASAIVPGIRQAVREIDPDVAIAKIAPLQGVVDAATETRRYQATLFSVFGGVALAIAVIGVYATTAYSIFQRRRELNIRAALGARVPQVVSLVLRQSLAPVVAGLAGGVAGALAAGGLVGTLLYEVRPRDPAVLTIVVAVVASVGIVSAGLATLGGLRINPAAALRED